MTQLQGGMGIPRLCGLAGSRGPVTTVTGCRLRRGTEGELRDRIHASVWRIVLMVYRRVEQLCASRASRESQKVRRLMREVPSRGARRKWVATTDSRHQLAVFRTWRPG